MSKEEKFEEKSNQDLLLSNKITKAWDESKERLFDEFMSMLKYDHQNRVYLLSERDMIRNKETSALFIKWKKKQKQIIEDKHPKCFGNAEKILIKDDACCDECLVLEECVNAIHFAKSG